eukprot:scaffold3163_cov134-Skeletonema_menzelii.AAC.5
MLLFASYFNSSTLRCLKKYCVCFNAGLKCNELCQCKNCGNQGAEEDDFLSSEVTEAVDIIAQAKSEVIVHAPPTKYVKVGDRQPTSSPFTDSSDSLDCLSYSKYYGLTPQSEVDPVMTAEV